MSGSPLLSSFKVPEFERDLSLISSDMIKDCDNSDLSCSLWKARAVLLILNLYPIPLPSSIPCMTVGFGEP